MQRVLTVLALVGALAVLFVAAALATREGEVLRDAPRDAADLDLPAGPLQPEDVTGVRLGLALRGYRMDEVDHLLERVVADLAARDAQIRDLEAALAAREAQVAALPDTDGPPDAVEVGDAPVAEAHRRALEAAAELESQAAAAPPLAGRGRFLGVRVRTADGLAPAEGDVPDVRPSTEAALAQGGLPVGEGDLPREGAGGPDGLPTGEGGVPGEEHHSGPDRVGGDPQCP